MDKVVLAFSGGLDTSFCVLYLKEKGYDVVTAVVNTGGFSEGKLKEIEEKSKLLGSIKHYTVDATEGIYEKIMQYLIKLNGLYEDEYPLMCADRYIIAEEILKIAKLEGTDIVAHGSTAVGNDQVRFEASLTTLSPNGKIIAPIKELNITRAKEIEYLEEKGFKVDKGLKKYSINENIFGITVSGTEIDQNKEPDEFAYTLTRRDESKTEEYLKIEFEKGLPVKLNDEEIKGIELISKLNEMLGSYGYGSKIYVGDCIIGIKGRIMFESPALLAIIEAHKKLEQIVLTKRQIMFGKQASTQWSDLVYGGLYYEPLVKNIEAYTDSVQEKVNGTVIIKVQPYSIQVVELSSPNSLVNANIAMYAQESKWSGTEANGFIKLYSMQQRLANIK
ncbi:argininosuccinate synthase [Gudongella oleilytica]|uniref:argininosuccinate synthase n=1 Tax=Gudongella oleilytica TaxID=1582259 RepID=UPI000FF88DCF|nr:argininosuccinate synthase [Gudongella oleilytica]